jgi:hypothetical protein
MEFSDMVDKYTRIAFGVFVLIWVITMVTCVVGTFIVIGGM